MYAALRPDAHGASAARWPEARQTVRVSDDVEIVVYSQGDGEVIVLLPSLGRGASDFFDIAERLATAGYRALCPQPRGLGGSTGPLHGITLHDFARDHMISLFSVFNEVKKYAEARGLPALKVPPQLVCGRTAVNATPSRKPLLVIGICQLTQ